MEPEMKLDGFMIGGHGGRGRLILVYILLKIHCHVESKSCIGRALQQTQRWLKQLQRYKYENKLFTCFEFAAVLSEPLLWGGFIQFM